MVLNAVAAETEEQVEQRLPEYCVKSIDAGHRSLSKVNKILYVQC